MSPLSLTEYTQMMRKRAAELPDRTQAALKRAADKGAKLARDKTRQEGIVDTGHFAEGWRSEDRERGAAVVNVAPYAPYVDDGRAPGGSPPPIAVLVRWVERRLGLGGKEALSAAHAIAERIAQRGVAGAKIAKWLGKQLTPIANQELDKELNKP